MSVKIRLQRRGTTNTPFYRIVVADSRMRRDGRFIEELGFYDPLKKPAVVKVDRASALRWMKNGAILSETVERIFSKLGILSDWARMQKGEPAPKETLPEAKIFAHREAPRLSKKAREKSAKAKESAEKESAEVAPEA